jgi:hypothetical protein
MNLAPEECPEQNEAQQADWKSVIAGKWCGQNRNSNADD